MCSSDLIMDHCLKARTRPDPQDLVDIVRPYLVNHFKAAFLGRVTIVPYFPLTAREIGDIARLKLRKIQNRMRDAHRAELTFDPAVIDAIVERATETESGARSIDAVLSNTVLAELSDEVLRRMVDGTPFSTIHVAVNEIGFLYTFE